ITLPKSPFLNNLDNGVVFVAVPDEISRLPLNEGEKSFLNKQLFEDDKRLVPWINEKGNALFITSKPHQDDHYSLENARKAGAKAWEHVKDWELLRVTHSGSSIRLFHAFIEGLMLASYRFDKYKSIKKKSLTQFEVFPSEADHRSFGKLESIVRATTVARDLVNEPASFLDALQLGKEIKNLGEEYGFETEILDKAKID